MMGQAGGSRRKNANRFPQKPPLEDGVRGKRVPNSLIWTLRGIRRLWRRPTEEGPREPKGFVSEFSESFKKVVALYPADKTEAKEIEQLLQRLEGGAGDISYYHLRTFSEHVGVPMSVLLMYSHVAGHVRRGFSKDEVLNLIDSTVLSFQALRHYVDDPSVDDIKGKFWESQQHRDGWTQYNAVITGLENMEAAFSRHHVSPAGEKPGIIG